MELRTRADDVGRLLGVASFVWPPAPRERPRFAVPPKSVGNTKRFRRCRDYSTRPHVPNALPRAISISATTSRTARHRGSKQQQRLATAAEHLPGAFARPERPDGDAAALRAQQR